MTNRVTTTQETKATTDAVRLLPRDRLADLFHALTARGYQVIGPRVDQGAIIYDQLTSVEELPRGWTDEQGPGYYRLKRREDDDAFGYVVGPHSWKRYLFPPLVTLARIERDGEDWHIESQPESPVKRAFLGVRACELAAIAVQDRVFLSQAYVDPIYQARRESVCLIAANCTQAAATCFCTSMDTGPRCRSGFDLAITEIAAGYIVEVGSELGASLAADLPLRPASPEDQSDGEAARARAVAQIERTLDTHDIRALLMNNLDHPQWDDVGQRCLSCTNCTMVCPTCFCCSVTEVGDLTEQHIERQRQWDSCFHPDFSYINGGQVRGQVRSRYRQWLTHKLATWIDQFDVSGCVGCGRCITWCPVGIDLTEEVAAIRGNPS